MDCTPILILSLVLLANAELRLPKASEDPEFPQKSTEFTDVQAFPSRSLRDIATKRRQLSYIKSLLQDLDDRLEKLQKRSCMLNLPGMDCDYGDISGSGKDQDFWGSRMTPGKKRRTGRSVRFLV